METILTLLSKGVISLGKTDKEDEYVLFVTTKDKNFAVPMLKTKSSTFAYVDEKVDVGDYGAISSLIEQINKSKVYKGLYSFKPILKKVPEHSHKIVSWVSGGIDGIKSVQPKNLIKVAKDLGYNFVEKSLGGEVRIRDYSGLLTDPINRAIFEADRAEVEAAGATAKLEKQSTEIKVAYEALLQGRIGGVLLLGPTGTGKSFLAKIIAVEMGAPLLSVQITEGTTVDDLVGSFVPDGKGGFQFVMGPLLKAYTLGFPLVIDELNFGSAGVIACANQFLDKTGRVTINGKTYFRNPNFIAFMTANPGYEGTNPLNVALKNRFIKVNVPALTKRQFVDRLGDYSKGLGHQLSPSFFEKLYDFSAFVEKESASSKWHENVKFSVRNAQSLCDSVLSSKKSFEDFFAAIAVAYINDLSCDNDNSEKLSLFKKQSDTVEQVRKLYDLYDFAEVKSVEVVDTFGSLFADIDEEKEEGEDKKDDFVDDIINSFSFGEEE